MYKVMKHLKLHTFSSLSYLIRKGLNRLILSCTKSIELFALNTVNMYHL